MRTTINVIGFSLLGFLSAVGCSTPRGDGVSSSALAQVTSAVDPQAMITAGGEFGFDLDASTTALASVTAGCAAEADPPACLRKIRAQAAGEGLRLVVVDADHTRFESFGREGEANVIYLAAVLAIDHVKASTVHAHATTPLTGTELPKDTKALDNVAIEVVDRDTIAMTDSDSEKGRLVFRRRAAR